jgi:iron complex outermembrane receptor protein
MIKHVSVIISALVASGAAASEKAVADTARVLDELVVIESAAKAPVPLLPLDVRIVGSDVIEKSTETNILPVLQNHIPGMFVTERGLAGYGVSGGAAGAVTIRGVGGGNKVLFLIDGQPQWAGIFGHSLPDTYVSNDVQRVEVVSGPSSLLYGSGAMGGSVNLITRRAESEGLNGSLRAMAGSYGTMKYGARAGYRTGSLKAYAAASYERSDGNRRGMGYWLANQYASLNYDFSSHWEAGANAMITETRADNPGSVYRTLPLDMWARQVRTTASVFVKNRYDISSGGIQAYYNWGKHKIDDGLDDNDMPRSYFFNSRDYNMGVTLYQTVKPWQGNDFSVGLDIKHWGGRAYNTDKTSCEEEPVTDRHVNEVAGYAMMQQALFDNRLGINAGVRLEHSSQFGNEWVPQAGLVFRPMSSNRLKFNFAKGFRSPNIRELYMYPPHNPDLKPERMNNFEVELRQWLPDKGIDVGMALYYINGDNLIQTVRQNGRPLNVNTGKFINKGFELDFNYSLSRIWSFKASYAYLHTDTRIVAAPKNKLFGEVSCSPGQWQFSLDAMGIWGLNNEETTQNYGVLNARAAYSVAMRTPLMLFVKGENLTAAHYQINYGFPMPGATVMAGLELRF